MASSIAPRVDATANLTIGGRTRRPCARAATVAVVALEPIQLRGEPLGSPLLVVRGGVNALADDLVRKTCLLSRNKWGFDGVSVFEAPDGNLED
jgi:hypothetical protein